MTKRPQIQTYDEANLFLSGKGERKIENNTWIVRIGGDSIGVKLHSTYVVIYYANGFIRLNSGGWRTSTTKNRIRHYADVRLYQKDFEWYLARPGSWDHTWLYHDHMLISSSERVPVDAVTVVAVTA